MQGDLFLGHTVAFHWGEAQALHPGDLMGLEKAWKKPFLYQESPVAPSISFLSSSLTPGKGGCWDDAEAQ